MLYNALCRYFDMGRVCVCEVVCVDLKRESSLLAGGASELSSHGTVPRDEHTQQHGMHSYPISIDSMHL